ncbi:TUBGCP5 [Blepharisma stoltei]|uniref:Spindle pole body component n=1 Tax=Blepharisma stoltei TaxID=1481888 RepID=A0AAU9JUD7_9CILI|nr:unnamed protein product [Blepharisma stoltei]
MSLSLFKQRQNQRTQKLVKELIIHETGVAENSNNYKIAHDFIISNITRHTYLDTDSHKVRRHCQGILEKIRVHSQIEKAERLEKLISSYLGKNPSEMQYSIISLLCLLSRNPLESDILSISPISLHLDEFASKTGQADIEFNEEELKQLYDGWGEFGNESSEESYDELNDELDDVEAEEKSIEKENEENRDKTQSYLINYDAPMPEEFDEEMSEPLPEPVAYERSWVDPCSLSKDFYESLVEREKKESGENCVLNWNYETVSERLIIDEILLMLFGVNTSLFHCDQNGFRLVKRIQVVHLTPSCLMNFLEFFVELGTLLSRIDYFSEKLKTDDCMTYQYFADGCKEFLYQTRSELVSIKEEFVVQAGDVTRESISRIPYNTITLISLKHRLYPILDLCKLILSIFYKAVLNLPSLQGETQAKTEFSLSYKASYLLSYLYILIQENHEITDHQGMCLVVNLFIKSVQPYIKFFCIWMSTGSLNNVSQEFMVYQKSKKVMGNFEAWNNAFDINMQEIDGRYVRCVPDFLKEIHVEILTAGKNMMIIKQIEEILLDKLLEPYIGLLKDLESKVTNNLYEKTAHCLSKVPKVAQYNIKTVSWRPKSSQFYEIGSESPENLFSIYESQPPPHIFSPITCNLPSYEISISEKEIFPLRPINHWISFHDVIKSSFIDTAHLIYEESAKNLLDLLKEHFDLDKHLEVLRGVLLMENGECMYPFVKFLNKKADNQEPFDNAYEITSMFGECLKEIKWKGAQNIFSCEIEGDKKPPSSLEVFTHLRLNFIPHPTLDIIFDPDTLQCYNKLFHRLLQIKRAAHCAKNLKWRIKNNPKIEKIQKRFLICQKELIHFTCCFEEYVMQNIINSCIGKFKNIWKEIKTIDEMREAHASFLTKILDRCLLLPKAAPINDAVSAIFGLCIKFNYLVHRMSGLDTELESYDDEISECYRILNDIQESFKSAVNVLVKILSRYAQRGVNYQYLGAYYSMNFNRYYLDD